ncbi:MAG: thiamine-phosphate kinase, partial [Planctomycetota bacterium]
MDELELVDWIVGRSSGRARGVKVGPGDDCAVLAGTGAEDVVFTIDEVVEGTHFRLAGRGTGPRARGKDVGYKALVTSASDIAAMGAEPVAAVAAAALRKKGAGRLGKAIHAGLLAGARETGCTLVGGNVTETAGPVTVTVAAIGRAPKGKACLRSGARAGDAVFVTGELGGSPLR